MVCARAWATLGRLQIVPHGAIQFGWYDGLKSAAARWGTGADGADRQVRSFWPRVRVGCCGQAGRQECEPDAMAPSPPTRLALSLCQRSAHWVSR